MQDAGVECTVAPNSLTMGHQNHILPRARERVGERSGAERASEERCVQTSERSGAREQSKQTSGWAHGPVLTTQFLPVLKL